MADTPTIGKFARWVGKRPEFTRRQAWMSCKNSIFKTAADLDLALTVLTVRGVISLDSSGRAPTYTVTNPVELPAPPTPRLIPQPVVPVESRPVSAEPPPVAITPPSPPSNVVPLRPSPTVPAVVSTPEPVVHAPVVTVQPMSDATLLTVAATRRARDGRIDHALEQIENRHNGRRIGDLFRVDELTRWDQDDLALLRKWIGIDPTFEERFALVARRVKQLPPESRKAGAVAAITSGVRDRNKVPKGTGLPSGYFHVQEIARLETILDGVE